MLGLKSYTDFASIYDRLISEDIDYTAIADYIEKIFERLKINPELVLDMACGTGSLTDILSRRGYDMIGLDLSDEMLAVAKKKNPQILYLCQDMCSFELYGTVDAICCMTDSLNYILDDEDLFKIFDSAKRCYLNPGAPFIFDMNSPYKLKHIIGENTFVYNDDDVFYSWENQFDDREKIADFFLTFFVKEGSLYRKFSEIHSEKAREAETVKGILLRAGFKNIDVYDGYTFEPINEKTERFMFIAR